MQTSISEVTPLHFCEQTLGLRGSTQPRAMQGEVPALMGSTRTVLQCPSGWRVGTIPKTPPAGAGVWHTGLCCVPSTRDYPSRASHLSSTLLLAFLPQLGEPGSARGITEQGSTLPWLRHKQKQPRHL